jgi:hypothetical protein
MTAPIKARLPWIAAPARDAAAEIAASHDIERVPSPQSNASHQGQRVIVKKHHHLGPVLLSSGHGLPRNQRRRG